MGNAQPPLCNSGNVLASYFISIEANLAFVCLSIQNIHWILSRLFVVLLSGFPVSMFFFHWLKSSHNKPNIFLETQSRKNAVRRFFLFCPFLLPLTAVMFCFYQFGSSFCCFFQLCWKMNSYLFFWGSLYCNYSKHMNSSEEPHLTFLLSPGHLPLKGDWRW